MSLTINTNLSSLIVQSSLKSSTKGLNQAIERMTTGYKINHAKDNAANYAIATQLSTKIGAYSVAEENAMMGLDMVQTASSSLDLMSDLASRLRALATQAQNGTYGTNSLTALNSEAQAIVQEMNRIKSTTTYNGIKLFGDNTAGGSGIATAALTIPTTVGIATNSLDEENIATYSSTVRYAQYDDDYVLADPLGDPFIYGKILFSDGTVLLSAENDPYDKFTWGDLVVPDTYTWSDEYGYYVDTMGNAMSLIIKSWDVRHISEDTKILITYGVEYIPDPTPDPVPDPTPTPPASTPSEPSAPILSKKNFSLGISISSSSTSRIDFELKDADISVLDGLDLTDVNALSTIDEVIKSINEQQTTLGAVENRLTSALEQIHVAYDNLVSTQSTILDADIAEESSNYIKMQILQQASATLMATANQSPAIALQLI